MIRVALVMVLTMGFAADFSAGQDEKGKKKGKRQGGKNPATQMMARFKSIDLTEEQKAKMMEIGKKFAGTLQELRKESGSAFSDDARKARQEAGKKARAEGLKGKDLQAAIDKAAPISDDVAAKMKEIRGKMARVQKEMREAMMAVLTDEQKAKLPKSGPGKAGKNKPKKKKEKKKKDDQ